jgi:hypothetical protein
MFWRRGGSVKEKSHWRWRSKQVLALAAIISLLPLPVLAGESNQPTPTTQTLSAAAAKVVAREVLKPASDGMEAARSGAPELRSAAYFTGGAPTAAAVRAEQEGTPTTRSATFFKTPAGVVVMAVLGVGVGYALYSAQHDRVHSAGKK